tara:strand:+ start:192 stop:404 length:213 start_codon:yes stop_codon:yes gene_type:complete
MFISAVRYVKRGKKGAIYSLFCLSCTFVRRATDAAKIAEKAPMKTTPSAIQTAIISSREVAKKEYWSTFK